MDNSDLRWGNTENTKDYTRVALNVTIFLDTKNLTEEQARDVALDMLPGILGIGNRQESLTDNTSIEDLPEDAAAFIGGVVSRG